MRTAWPLYHNPRKTLILENYVLKKLDNNGRKENMGNEIKNGINEMTGGALFFGNMNLCSSELNQSMKISRDFSLERRHTQNEFNPNIQTQITDIKNNSNPNFFLKPNLSQNLNAIQSNPIKLPTP